MRIGCILCFIFLISGCKGPEPRKPVKVKSGSFFKQSVARNKLLLAEEEKVIKDIIAKDTLHEYVSDPNGFWYYYELKNDTAQYTPKTNDQILFSYNVRTLEDKILYNKQDIGPISYTVDKEQLFPGLQNAVKLLKINERINFIFPSLQAYGYLGDGNAIGPKTPIQASVELYTIIIDPDSLNLKSQIK